MLNPKEFTDTFLGNYKKLKPKLQQTQVARSPYNKMMTARYLCRNRPGTWRYSLTNWCLLERRATPGPCPPSVFKIRRFFWIKNNRPIRKKKHRLGDPCQMTFNSIIIY
jgi:hypothetical protein